MTEEYTIPLAKIIKELGLRAMHLPQNAEEILIRSRDVIRPGLELYGFCDYFDPHRITVLGRSEMAMLQSLGEEKKATAIEHFFALRPATVIVARDITPSERMLAAAEKYDIPLLSSKDSTSNVVADLVSLLNVELAPRITRHGVLIEVYGEGILLVGDSGVGKIETAIELIKRGHRLIADDAVEIRRVSSKSLVGRAPENIRHFIELRGVGIINARRIFGMGAIKMSEKIDMCINLEISDETRIYYHSRPAHPHPVFRPRPQHLLGDGGRRPGQGLVRFGCYGPHRRHARLSGGLVFFQPARAAPAL